MRLHFTDSRKLVSFAVMGMIAVLTGCGATSDGGSTSSPSRSGNTLAPYKVEQPTTAQAADHEYVRENCLAELYNAVLYQSYTDAGLDLAPGLNVPDFDAVTKWADYPIISAAVEAARLNWQAVVHEKVSDGTTDITEKEARFLALQFSTQIGDDCNRIASNVAPVEAEVVTSPEVQGLESPSAEDIPQLRVKGDTITGVLAGSSYLLMRVARPVIGAGTTRFRVTITNVDSTGLLLVQRDLFYLGTNEDGGQWAPRGQETLAEVAPGESRTVTLVFKGEYRNGALHYMSDSLGTAEASLCYRDGSQFDDRHC
jgi:hypothetical protein